MSVQPSNKYDVAVIGGGLAGLSAAIELSLRGAKVVLFEKKDYPRHKVCGEYVSNEVLPILSRFGCDPFKIGGTRIRKFTLSAPSGKTVSSELPLGAFGLSRYQLDQMLWQRAVELGVDVHTKHQVREIGFHNGMAEIKAQKDSYYAQFVVGAFGKTSNLSVTSSQKTHGKYIGVKRHVQLAFPNDEVALHNFDGGYCGVSKVEDNRVNICYLAPAKAVRDVGGVDNFEQRIMSRNPHLKSVLEEAIPLFERPLAISNFAFGAEKPVVDHVFMAGDSAGMISPLCGNGMAMAITSGYQLAEILDNALSGRLSRGEAERAYTRQWQKQFSSRMWWGNRLQSLFGKPGVANFALSVLSAVPAITPFIIKQTHGEPNLA